jgi:dipeptidyl aminopeptidase/acylaminoacyl peptidase
MDEKIIERVFQISTPSGAELYGDIRWKEEMSDSAGRKLPIIIVCHGFKAFKDWGPFPAIGRYFAESGFVSIVFNFSHNGIGKNFRKFSEREKFSVNTFSLELEDVTTILDAISMRQIDCRSMDDSKIGIVGHSRGGGIAIIKAREDKRIRAVAGWSTVSYFDRYTEGQRKRWREKGFVGLPSINPESLFRLRTDLLDDLEKNGERLNIKTAVHDLGKPLLLIHGTADLPVPIEEVKSLYEISDKTMTELILLEGIGHMYGARHPYVKPAPAMSRVLDLTAAWFHKHL